mmetsp:Transcript_15572/g.33986  ORF Transcript_15572/g.33986 Transcript_15572/m.33986 type:complete len:85 (-) Transcript_15572:1296-1550(-)
MGDEIALNSASLQAKARSKLKSSRVFSLLETHTRTRFTTVAPPEYNIEFAELEDPPDRGADSGFCACFGCELLWLDGSGMELLC